MNTSLPTTLPGSTYLDGGAVAPGGPSAQTGPAGATAPADFASLLGGVGAIPVTVPVPTLPLALPAVVPNGPSSAGQPATPETAPMLGGFANVISFLPQAVATVAATEADAPVAPVPTDGEAEPVDGLDRSELEALLALVAPLAPSQWQVVTTPAGQPQQVQDVLADPKSLALARQLGQIAGPSVDGEEAAPAVTDEVPATGSSPELRMVSAELELVTGARVVLRPGSPTTVTPAAEKTAASGSAPEISGINQSARVEKTTQSVNVESFDYVVGDSGIDVAKKPIAMPQPAAPFTAPVVPTFDRAWAGVAPTESIEVSAEVSAELPVRAAEVVQSVVDVVEAQAASRLQPVPSVTVRFDIGEGALAVRVEMRDGEVRTEFKTDSRELQTALAHEWRSVATTLESGVRLADPVFTTTSKSDPAGFNGAAGESFSQSRSSGRSSEEYLAAQSVRGLRSRRAPSVDDAPVAAVVSRHVPTSQRLSVLA